MLYELKSLNSNFINIPISKHCTSKFIAIWLSNMFNIFYVETQTALDLAKNIDSMIYCLKHIGTDASLTRIFKTFLNVDIEVTVPSSGVINIKLLGAIQTNFIAKISPSSNTNKNKKIRIHYRLPNDENMKCGTLIFNYLPKGYAHSIYAFIKSLIPVGRTLKLQDQDDNEIITFNS